MLAFKASLKRCRNLACVYTRTAAEIYKYPEEIEEIKNNERSLSFIGGYFRVNESSNVYELSFKDNIRFADVDLTLKLRATNYNSMEILDYTKIRDRSLKDRYSFTFNSITKYNSTNFASFFCSASIISRLSEADWVDQLLSFSGDPRNFAYYRKKFSYAFDTRPRQTRKPLNPLRKHIFV